LRDDAAKSRLFADAFNVLWYGLLVIVLLLAFKHDIASSVGVSALSFLLDVLCYWQWTQASSGDSSRQKRRSRGASYKDFNVIFFVVGLLCKGLDVISIYI